MSPSLPWTAPGQSQFPQGAARSSVTPGSFCERQEQPRGLTLPPQFLLGHTGSSENRTISRVVTPPKVGHVEAHGCWCGFTGFTPLSPEVSGHYGGG